MIHYIKIVKTSGSKGVWYNNKIGQIFKVEDYFDKKHNTELFKILDYKCDNHKVLYTQNDMIKHVTEEDYNLQQNISNKVTNDDLETLKQLLNDLNIK